MGEDWAVAVGSPPTPCVQNLPNFVYAGKSVVVPNELHLFGGALQCYPRSCVFVQKNSKSFKK